MEKVDLYNYQNRWNNWKDYIKDKDIEEISKNNSDLIKQFLFDMEVGRNVSVKNKKGGRSFSRLNVLRDRLTYLAREIEKLYHVDLIQLNSSQIIEFFDKMRRGSILKKDKTKFKSVADYVKVFKTFWHWWAKINRLSKKPKYIIDITEDLDTSYELKPNWVYLDEKQMIDFIDDSNDYYKPIISFFYDTGCRVTEGFSVRVSDISVTKGEVFVNFRDEITKGGGCGRKIKLMLCGKPILEFIKQNNLKQDDCLFSIYSQTMTNNYLSKYAEEKFGKGKSLGDEYYSRMTLYDVRHIACCFWIERYKRSSDIMYRFGWRTEKYIHYYSEFLGKHDKISQEDMYVDVTKTELEKELKQIKRQLGKYLPILKKLDENPEAVNTLLNK